MTQSSQFDLAWEKTIALLRCDDLPSRVLLENLKPAYAQGARHYHTIAHVIHCLDTLATYPHEIPERSAIELALWYHDAIYDPKRSDNERRSADLLETEFAPTKMNRALIERAKELVVMTDHRRDSPDRAGAIIADVDMAILASDPNDYQSYIRQIRCEYSCFDDEAFAKGRTQFLKHFLAKPQIYQTPYYFQTLEKSARRNMSEELAYLSQSVRVD